ncbi:hypothetical protein TWF696_007669 [Orbilia brochopaga]|uniref:Uncharacterized protein n=1 Tax=Orbilia brochopaga TaxID=3140254 RepID=A0AAV9UL22_9PEZI
MSPSMLHTHIRKPGTLHTTDDVYILRNSNIQLGYVSTYIQSPSHLHAQACDFDKCIHSQNIYILGTGRKYLDRSHCCLIILIAERADVIGSDGRLAGRYTYLR